MKKVLIIQARMTSSRLPGKILSEIEGRPLLAHVLDRAKRIAEIDDLVIATTDLASDDAVVSLAEGEGVRWFRGDEKDVLGRFAGAAAESAADVVVRVTADCPLLDPEVSGRVLEALEEDVDYASNVLERSYPRGLDTEAFRRSVLDRMARAATSPQSREHVTWYLLKESPDSFVKRSVVDSEDHSDLRWTVDTREDLEMVRKLYARLELGRMIRPYREILSFVRAHPDIAAINANIAQKDS